MTTGKLFSEIPQNPPKYDFVYGAFARLKTDGLRCILKAAID